ncbi:hypothetical protein E2C01_093207 [Portunus trituberculatus]|uniref:Uncharacterized protein n=1 Tax=Portunus trituberculatus TaxID=210409 RepID=A0A5B7JSM2_PORTR|nr:hypothetical protein [Portunus trituberculatus]
MKTQRRKAPPPPPHPAAINGPSAASTQTVGLRRI